VGFLVIGGQLKESRTLECWPLLLSSSKKASCRTEPAKVFFEPAKQFLRRPVKMSRVEVTMIMVGVVVAVVVTVTVAIIIIQHSLIPCDTQKS
jgi:hypothetical protein